ncbi:hypothetical protein H0H87_012717 [Tephrocybe sp. NHM501043]|nr:hypothetical protein H0H87_012717 [Tephrocybe sp. NHM501043]
MHATLRLLRQPKPSSTAWLSRQFRDPYVKQRLSDPRAYRSRSAFKLLEIDGQWDNFLSKPDVSAIVDLGAAPGGWSQVSAGKLGWDVNPPPRKQPVHKLTYKPDQQWSTSTAEELPSLERGRPPHRKRPQRRPEGNTEEQADFDPLNIDDVPFDNHLAGQGRGTIVAVDLLRMHPIPGVHCIQADFLSREAETLIEGLLSVKGNPSGKVDVILSDMAANTSGNHTADTESSLEICHAVLEFATRHLRTAEEIGRKRGGVLLMKHFQDPLLHNFRMRHLTPMFNDVRFVKPDSSRSDSREGYFLCQGWKGL